MSGEATSTSIILQSRLTVSDTLIDGDLPGKSGVGSFQIDSDPEFDNPISSGFIEALPENDFIIKTKIDGLKRPSFSQRREGARARKRLRELYDQSGEILKQEAHETVEEYLDILK